jgi:hypothetical protein
MEAHMSQNKEFGEGNYEASRRYRERTEQFVESGRVEQAAEEAKNASPAETNELERAEAEGRERAAEEDPQLRKQD